MLFRSRVLFRSDHGTRFRLTRLLRTLPSHRYGAVVLCYSNSSNGTHAGRPYPLHVRMPKISRSRSFPFDIYVRKRTAAHRFLPRSTQRRVDACWQEVAGSARKKICNVANFRLQCSRGPFLVSVVSSASRLKRGLEPFCTRFFPFGLVIRPIDLPRFSWTLFLR